MIDFRILRLTKGKVCKYESTCFYHLYGIFILTDLVEFGRFTPVILQSSFSTWNKYWYILFEQYSYKYTSRSSFLALLFLPCWCWKLKKLFWYPWEFPLIHGTLWPPWERALVMGCTSWSHSTPLKYTIKLMCTSNFIHCQY